MYHVHLTTALIVSELSTWFLHANFCGKRSSSKNPSPSDFMVASLEWPSCFPVPPCGLMSHYSSPQSRPPQFSILSTSLLVYPLPPQSLRSSLMLTQSCVSVLPAPPLSICTSSLQSLREQGSLLSESRSYLAPGSLAPHPS